MASSADLITSSCSCGCSSQPQATIATWSGTGESVDPTTGLERTRYFARQLVGHDDLEQDQIYVADRLRRHNRFLHGWGIACGLVVSRCGTEDGELDPCLVKVSAGYGLDPFGNEVFVPEAVVIDLCHQDGGRGLVCPPAVDPWCAPINTIRSGEPRYLAVRHLEIPVKPVLGPVGCSCSDVSCEYSRIRDWYEFSLLDELPAHYDQPCAGFGRRCSTVGTCLPCPESGWIVLATVVVDGDGITSFQAEGHRRYLVSLQQACFTCDEGTQDHLEHGFVEAKRTFVGVAASEPDATVAFDFYYDGAPAEAVMAVRAADIEGRTAADLKADWDDITMFDSTNPGGAVTGGQVLKGGDLLAHSPLRGDSVLDGIADLETRVGTPVVDVAAYRDAVSEVEHILDNAGYSAFRSDALADTRRLGTLGVEALTSVSKVNADRLRAVGISTLDDLRRAERLPELTSAAAATVGRARELLGRLGDRPLRR